MPGSGSPDRSRSAATRAVALGGGGLTAIAWLDGVLAELPPVLQAADRVIGTSGGALLAARLLGGAGRDGLDDLAAELAGARISAGAAARLVGAQLWPSRRHALIWLGRRRRDRGGLGRERFVDLVGRAVGTDSWPDSLVVTAVDAATGRPAYFTARSGVPLARAVAASCAMPGVLPDVTIDGRRFLDGGLRSPANADLASGCDRVLILAPQARSVRELRRPAHQADRLRAEGAEVVLVADDRPDADPMSPRGLDAARERGHAAGRRASGAVSVALLR